MYPVIIRYPPANHMMRWSVPCSKLLATFEVRTLEGQSSVEDCEQDNPQRPHIQRRTGVGSVLEHFRGQKGQGAAAGLHGGPRAVEVRQSEVRYLDHRQVAVLQSTGQKGSTRQEVT